MKHINLIFAAIAIALCVILVFAENLTPAYALSVTTYDNNADEAHGIARCGSTIITSDFSTDDIHFYSASSPTTHLGEITSGGGFTVGCNSSNDRAFTYDSGGTLQEIDIANRALLRSLATGCDSSHQYVDGGLLFVCGTSTATDQVKIINLASMSITYTSTTLDDGGANECDNIIALWYNSPSDTLFATCLTVDRIVAVVGFSVSGSPDASTTLASATLFGLAFNNVDSNILVCDTGALSAMFDWSGVAFSAGAVFAVGGCTNIKSVDFDANAGWFIAMDGSGNMRFYDALAETQLLSFNIGNVGASYGFHFYTSTYIPIALATNTDFAILDATGISFGSGATGEPSTPNTGVDCTQPENANILICRLGSDGSLVGAGNFIVGNVNGTTGLTPIICATGIVDCVANPDMKTNGVGYLLVTIALAIIIGILWVASRGDLNSIPTFIWFIATLAVVGAFTLMDLIDATFLVITVVFIVALAAAKARGLFGGGDFK